MLALLVLSGCGGVLAGQAEPAGVGEADRALVVRYFEDGNAAAQRGSSAQQELFGRTQYPDFQSGMCRLDGMTVTVEPAWTTLRPDPKWAPDGNVNSLRGNVYVVAVSVTAHRDRATVGNQIGSQHIVVLNGMAYGFAPCVN